jgi:HPt (histidine-containing phosphotransfer) domain-containing protein
MNDAIADVSAVFEYTGELTDKQLIEFLSQYVERLTHQQQQIQQLVNNKNFSAIRPLVHSIKSNALYIKALSLSAGCAQMEKLIDNQANQANQANDDITQCWPMLSEQFTQVINFLHEVINAKQGC